MIRKLVNFGVILAIFTLPINPAFARFYGEKFCNQPGFHCVKIKKSETGNLTWPDPRELEIVEKINRVHKWLSPGATMLVPDDMNGKTYMNFSDFPKTLKEFKNNTDSYLELNGDWKKSTDLLDKISDNEKVVIWAPELLAWAAYKNGKLINWGPGLGGADRCKDKAGLCRTPSGIFEALIKKGYNHHSDLYPKGCKGKDCSWMPYAVRVREDGLSMHGSKWFIGHHASHGCVRLFTKDAKWLNQKFFDYKTKDRSGTKVIFLPYPASHREKNKTK